MSEPRCGESCNCQEVCEQEEDEQLIYIYEADEGNTILIKADEDEPSVMEVVPGADITGDELAGIARYLGYKVIHWRMDARGLSDVAADGTENRQVPAAGVGDITHVLINGRTEVGSA